MPSLAIFSAPSLPIFLVNDLPTFANVESIEFNEDENAVVEIVFDNSIEHYGTSQTDTHLRILINFSFIRE